MNIVANLTSKQKYVVLYSLANQSTSW